MPSPFLLKAFTTAPLNATANKSIFFSRSTSLGMISCKESKDALLIFNSGESMSPEAKITLEKFVVYLNF